MNKNILIINTENCETAWLEYFKELNQKKFNLFLLANDPKLLSFFNTKRWNNKNFQAKINPQKNFISSLIFFSLRPILFFPALFKLALLKLNKKISSIVCFGFYEKLYFTRAAKLLGLKIIWIINPGPDLQLSKISQKSLTRLSKLATTICLNEKCKENLSIKKLKNIKSIKIGIKSKQHLEQKNIFESLARNNSTNNKKFFTIGTIQDLTNNVDHIEKLLHATKKCLQVIPQIQLIIAGEGEARKKLSWMTKKMEIDNLVWFVGNHKNPQKWLSNFDLFISTNPEPKLKDLNTVLLASLGSLSVIAPSNAGFKEFINNNNTGILVDINNSEELASAIIDLQQNSNKRKQFGENGQKFISNNFQLDNTINELSAILEK